jgi:acetylornithine/succinyldiaminopimelate/putrescine aminotransferase
MFKKEIEKHEAVDHIRQVGLMLAVEIKESYSISKLVKILQQNGLIVDQFLFNNTSFRIAPPLTISFDEIKLAIHKLKRSLDTLIKK